MPVSWTIQDNLVVLSFFGTHSFRDVQEAAEAALASDDFRPGMQLLIDACSSYNYTTTDDNVERVAWLASLQSRGLAPRCAILTSPRRAEIAERTRPGFAAHGMEMQVFTEPDLAMAWLRQDGGAGL